MSMVLSFFGACQVTQSGEPVVFATNAVRALLAYLATEADRPHAREVLAGLLWPDQPQAAASTNFRQTLVRLRKALGDSSDSVLSITSQSVQFNSASHAPSASQAPVESDVAHFERLLAECASHHLGTSADLAHCPSCIDRLRQAVALYRGEFLQGLFLKNSEPFDEWMLLKREQLHRKVLAALGTLTQAAEAGGSFEQMRQYAERELSLEPWSESAHAQLMRALAYAGQRTAALAQFQTCRRVLQDELGIEPSAETCALAERIRAGEASAFSAPQLTAPTPPHNLPSHLTAFVGRERELDEVMALVRESGPTHRLITLVGPGGMGKTRLALEAARMSLDSFPDGVFFISLAPLTSPSAIVPAIAAAIGWNVQGSDPKLALLNALRAKRMLLVLDNFEHVIEGAGLTADILQHSEGTHILATSRERLHVQGERIFTVEGMDYGDDESGDVTFATPNDIHTPAALRLFAQHVRGAQPAFQLSEATLPAVYRICHLVQGMPLGLELAAAWAETLSLQEIADEIEHSADFLAYDWRDVPARQRSLRAVFEWSWHLLTDEERKRFRQLSVFRGGFTREAAQAVAGATLTSLTQLAHKSLLRRGEAGRYEIHELLRQFAAEQLEAVAEERDATLSRHSTFYLHFLSQRERRLARNEPREAAQEIRIELDNVRRAWPWAAKQAQVDALNRSAYALWQFFWVTGGWLECEQAFRLASEFGQAQLADATGYTAMPPADRQAARRTVSKLMGIRASLLLATGRHDQALGLATQVIASSQASGSDEGEALGTLVLGQALRRNERSQEAREILERAAQLTSLGRARQLPFEILPHVECRAYSWLCSIALSMDDYVEAQRCVEAGLALCRSLKRTRDELAFLTDLADIAMVANDFGAARRHCEAALQLAHKLGDAWGQAACQRNLGEVTRHLGEYGLSHEMTVRSLAIGREIGDLLLQVTALTSLGHLHVLMGDYEFAQACFDDNARLLQEMEIPARESCLRLLPLALLARATGRLQQALAYAEEAWRRIQELDGLVNQAKTLVILGHIHASLNHLPAATAAYQHALDLLAKLGRAHHMVEARTGLAGVALAQQDWPAAMAQVEALLPVLAQHPHLGIDEPFRVYLTCYKVLSDAGDARANSVLQAAQTLLHEYAGGITDPKLWHSFLEEVAVNRELQALGSANEVDAQQNWRLELF